MATKPLAILAAGGTGGHMFPAQALAEALLAQGWRVKLSTDPRGARYVGGFPDDVKIQVVSSGTFSKRNILQKLLTPFRLFFGTISASLRMLFDRPDVVVGFGGYPAVPAMAAAVITRRPRIIHEQNGVLGRVNQFFARYAHVIACGTWPTVMPKGVTGVPVGNPVRQAVLDRHGAGYIKPGDYPMEILVIGGSQGARILSDVVPAAVGMLDAPILSQIRVAQQARVEDIDRVEAAYAAIGVSAEIAPFFDDIPRRMSETQLVISRSGASSVADISIIGRPSILVPLAAAVRDEQTVNARELAENDAALVIKEAPFAPETVAGALNGILGNAELARTMAAAALSCARPNATTDLMQLVIDAAEENK